MSARLHGSQRQHGWRCRARSSMPPIPYNFPYIAMKGAAPGTYSGVLDTFVKTFKTDGPLAFYNGFGPNFARLGT